jgi:hypothetical protein
MNAGFTYWKEDKHWLGYLEEFPDYWTQGETVEDLKTHLLDLWRDLNSGVVPNVRRHEYLEVA